MKLDPSTTVGIVVAAVAILGGIALEGGNLMSVVEFSAFIIVLGGGIGVTLASFTMEELKTVPKVFKQIVFTSVEPPTESIKIMVELADKARREGILVLEKRMEEIDDDFLKKGIQLIVDGNDASVVRDIMETEIESQQERHGIGAQFFETAGGYLPTIGILGTVLGLVHALENLEDPSTMGPAIATAFIATLYGVGFANVIFLPIASRLKRQSESEIRNRELLLEGILSIQAGANPRVVEEKLHAFIAPSSREPVLESVRA